MYIFSSTYPIELIVVALESFCSWLSSQRLFHASALFAIATKLSEKTLAQWSISDRLTL